MSIVEDRIDFDDALQTLGAEAATIPADQRHQLDEQGFVVLPGLIDPAWLAALRETFERLHRDEGARAGLEVSDVPGVRRLADLVNKSPVFDRLWVHPQLLAAAHHLIGRPFKLHSLNGHDPLPGHGAQGLHTDTEVPRETVRQCHVVNSMWMLDDVGPDNGATRVVPATHRQSRKPCDALRDPAAPHPDEVPLVGPAGTVAIFHGHVWHSCTVNRSARTRRLIHCAFIGRELPQQTNQRRYLREATLHRLSPAAHWILDV